MSTTVGNNTRLFTDSASAFCWQVTNVCSKMLCGVTFEFEFSDLIATSTYVKRHQVGDIKSIFFLVPIPMLPIVISMIWPLITRVTWGLTPPMSFKNTWVLHQPSENVLYFLSLPSFYSQCTYINATQHAWMSIGWAFTYANGHTIYMLQTFQYL